MTASNPYRPRRDHRFEYLTDVMSFVERNQCNGCGFKSDRPDYPMCFEVEGELFAENGPVAALDDRGNDGVVCVLFRDQELVAQEHPDQRRLL